MSKNDYRIVLRPLTAEEGGGWLAEVSDLPGCITDGETREEALANVEAAIQSWIEAALEFGESVPEPVTVPQEFSGKFTLRLPRTLHRDLTEAAESEGISLNQYLIYLLSERNVIYQEQKQKPATFGARDYSLERLSGLVQRGSGNWNWEMPSPAMIFPEEVNGRVKFFRAERVDV